MQIKDMNTKEKYIGPSGNTERRLILMNKNLEEWGINLWRSQDPTWSLKDWNIEGKLGKLEWDGAKG